MNKTATIIFGVLGGFFSGVFSTGKPLYVISIKNSVQNVKIFRATMIGVLGLGNHSMDSGFGYKWNIKPEPF